MGTELDLERCRNTRDLLSWLSHASRQDIMAVCVIVRNQLRIPVPCSGTHDQLLQGLRRIPFKSLLSIIDTVFPESDDDDAETEEIEEDAGDQVDETDDAEQDEDAESDEEEEEEEEPAPIRKKGPTKFRYER